MGATRQNNEQGSFDGVFGVYELSLVIMMFFEFEEIKKNYLVFGLNSKPLL